MLPYDDSGSTTEQKNVDEESDPKDSVCLQGQEAFKAYLKLTYSSKKKKDKGNSEEERILGNQVLLMTPLHMLTNSSLIFPKPKQLGI